ncbi:unnamed protein product [Thlaspi arvense]|uniref:PUM-HD domain-containing protein n=1 Tax=Thlaspi arvense TaxID=13288 RepID=A0AAU9SIV4_THLAR|nr:unnamed protein product [Thlaspi arvense]
MANDDRLTMSEMLNSLQHLRLSAATEESPTVPPPPRDTHVNIPPPRDTHINIRPPPRGTHVNIRSPPRDTNVNIPPPRDTHVNIPPPPRDDQPQINSFPVGFFAPSNRQELEMCLQVLFILMTKSENEDDAVPFKDMISNLDITELQGMASLLTSDSDYFLEIAKNRNGSKRLQKLLGKSSDADAFFSAAILSRFFHVMTDKHASHVARQGLQVFDDEKKEAMYEYTLDHALHLARDRYGCIALNETITDLDHPFYRNYLLDIVVHNAHWLSYDDSGNFVVQHVLKLNDLRCTYNIAAKLDGHCVDLASQKYGSYIVERLLETDESRLVVVVELLECNDHKLLRLARGEYGNFVVGKALRLTQEEVMVRPYLLWGLVHKLMRLRSLLGRSRGSNVAAILDSICEALSQ